MRVRPARRAAAWAVHVFTATGAVCGLMALAAVADDRPVTALAWMFAAVVIDGADGFLARAVGAREATPAYDGALLDNLVDYLNYAVVPAFFLLRLGPLTGPWGLMGPSLIVLASAYQFGQTEAKTADHFFRGFPSYWNVVALYLHFLAPSPVATLAVIAGLALASFIPVRWAYPSRMPRLRRPTLTLAILWGGMLGYVLWTGSLAMLHASMAFVVYYVGVSLWLGRRRDG